MNMSSDSYYIVVNYTSSLAVYFPENKAQHFRVKLAKPLDFKDSVWTVGLCEILLNDVLTIPTQGETYPSIYSVDFGPCSGLNIYGNSSHSLRIIPNTVDGHLIFHKPFYLPVETEYIDTFEITIKTLEGNLLKLYESNNTLITCTLHFKKTRTL